MAQDEVYGHTDLSEWAISRGIKLNGVAAHTFPDRGLGLIAEKRIEVRPRRALTPP